MKKLLSVIAVLGACAVLTSALTACGGKKAESKSDGGTQSSVTDVTKGEETTAAPEDDGLSDYDWMKFKMPEGFEEFGESDSYTTIQETENSKHKMKFFRRTKSADTDMDAIVDEEVSKDTDRYSKGETFQMGNYTWVTENFTFNSNDSRKFYTQLDDTHYAYITVFEMTEADDAVKTVLESFTADPSKI